MEIGSIKGFTVVVRMVEVGLGGGLLGVMGELKWWRWWRESLDLGSKWCVLKGGVIASGGMILTVESSLG